jgi:hypothetical protein
MMNTQVAGSYSRYYSLPRSGSKPTLHDKLERVFQMADNVDARCADMLGAATQKRRTTIFVR